MVVQETNLDKETQMHTKLITLLYEVKPKIHEITGNFY